MDTPTRKKIMVVDDEVSTRMSLAFYFAQLGNDVIECETGEDCLAQMSDEISILTLDIGLPGIDGIETCRRLREMGFSKTQIIFVSAFDDLQTRLTAYDVGGSDFIVKPFDQQEVERKVRVAERNLDAYSEAADRAKYAQEAAFSAMSSLGEMGGVLEFIRRSFASDSPKALADAIFACLGQFGLEGLVSLKIGHSFQNFRLGGACTPLEDSILENSRELQRIFQFSNRLVIHYPLATLLVTNLPLDNPDFCGRLRDHLAVVVEGAHTRVENLMQQTLLEAKNQAITTSMNMLVQTLDAMRSSYTTTAEQTRERTQLYLDQLEDAFVHLGLTDGQESKLISLARQTLNDVSSLLEQPKSLQIRFNEALKKLEESKN